MPIIPEIDFGRAMMIIALSVFALAYIVAYYEVWKSGSRKGLKILGDTKFFLAMATAGVIKGTSLAVHHQTRLRPEWLAAGIDIVMCGLCLGVMANILWMCVTRPLPEMSVVKRRLDRIGGVVVFGLLTWWFVVSMLLKADNIHYLWYEVGIGLISAPFILKLYSIMPKPPTTEEETPEPEGHFLDLTTETMRSKHHESVLL